MKHQLQQIRTALESADEYQAENYHDYEGPRPAITAALTALSELEAMGAEQEPCGWFESPYGAFRGNPLLNITFPASTLTWQIPAFIATPPAQQPPEIEVQCPVCNHKFYEWSNDRQPQYEAADMASAAAQGFRDGVASVVQQPQAETDDSIAADAYVMACQELEHWQQERRKAGKDAGTTGSLVDGIAWLYGYIDDLEARQPQAEAVPEMHDALCPALTGGDCTCTPPAAIDKAWALICGGIGRGPDAPYPGMIEAFEAHYGQVFTDKDWREETGVWAAAWKAAKAHGEAAHQQAEELHHKPVRVCHIKDVACSEAAVKCGECPEATPQQAEAVPSDVVRDAERWRTFLATRPANTHAVINQAIDDAATRKGGGV